MGLFLGFAPFIVFVFIERLSGVTAALVSATLVSVALLARNLISRKKPLKALEIGTVVLFSALAV